MRNDSRGFIHGPILIAIAVGVLVLGATGYFGVKQYKAYQVQKNEKENLAQELQKLQDEKDSQSNSDIEALKKEIGEIKNGKLKVITNTIFKDSPQKSSSKTNDLTSIISEWRPYVGYIECDYRYTNGKTAGSATLIGGGPADDYILILTNKHVVVGGEGYGPSSCRIKFPEDTNFITVDYQSIFPAKDPNYDFVGIKVLNPSSYLRNLTLRRGPNICGHFKSTSQEALGSSIIILGYPTIGSQSDITVTEGIISGLERDYYITSAKVEHGNSGGAAILVKDNCFLGIPTFAESGSVESLARILDINAAVISITNH